MNLWTPEFIDGRTFIVSSEEDGGKYRYYWKELRDDGKGMVPRASEAAYDSPGSAVTAGVAELREQHRIKWGVFAPKPRA